jgi:transcriptional regulator with XRE-family HTH domain
LNQKESRRGGISLDAQEGHELMAGESTAPALGKRQQLAAELRRSRELGGISGRELAQRIGISQSKVSRIESGATIPSLPEVKAWAEAVGATVERQELLVALTESVFTEVHGWQAALHARTHLQDEIEERETRASRVRIYQPSVVPGLLQTAEYARRLFAMSQVPHPVDDLSAAVAGRLQRQLALYEVDRRFEFLITEAALRWRPNSVRVLLAQLDRIASLSTLENVSIGLVPLDSQAVTPTSHGFIIYDLNDRDHDSFVEVETIHANLIVNAAEQVELYEKRWLLLSQMAIFDDDARKFLTNLATKLRAKG